MINKPAILASMVELEAARDTLKCEVCGKLVGYNLLAVFNSATMKTHVYCGDTCRISADD